ncbi:MAG: glycosyltransferase family 1 protein [Bacteroidota bacterium]|nr:glycosyltransferase family 1 protein [Bacteroidota bacterium]
MPTLCLLFRRPNPNFFSIEKIFAQLCVDPAWELPTEKAYVPSPSSSLRAILKNLWFVRRQRADIYHVTGDIHYAVLALPSKRVLLTIHDCVFMHRSSGLKRRLFKWLFLDLPVRHCRMITTISEATKRDIVQYTGCPPDKVIVIPNPLSGSIRFQPAAFRQHSPVILFIGVTPNKNLERVIAALQGIDCVLTIIGQPPPTMLALLERHRIRYAQRANLTEEELADQYIASDMVLFPSVFEGFGLPVIEAQKAGRPVITSNLSPMKEVAGQGACLVDPYDPASIRQAVMKIMMDKAYREELVQAGFRNTARFAPEKIVAQYMTCYRQLLTGTIQSPLTKLEK